MPDPTPDPLEPLIKQWLQSDEPDGALERLCAEHPEHAEALRARCASSLAPASEPAAPSQVGPYRILDTLGEGGMGTVYLAEQREPVRRRVALKLIKLGMDSQAVVRRFEQERQALALMDHEGIAKVYDVGTSERGQPYFVMELVKGVPIDTFCEKQRLSLSERLELMQQVCAAVQHAHHKGVVHRDLKPGNVLVSNLDGRLQIKIIDFGLAKAMGANLIDGSLFTELGVVVGTPEYMAPEQADPSNLDIDTRADVYSIGVMLYQLLVSALPFSGRDLRKAGLLEMQRVLREDDPPLPSTKLLAAGQTSAAVASQLRVSVGALRKALKGDLDWVVLKALEKDRNRRYESATALAEDLQRFLDHEPLEAGPPSPVYRLQKLLRRHRAAFLAAALVLAALLFGAVTTYVQWQRAEQQAQENLELAERNAVLATSERESKEAAEAALKARDEAFAQERQRAAQLEQVVQFQRGQFTRVSPEDMGAQLRRLLRRGLADRWRLRGVDDAAVAERLAVHDQSMKDVDFTGLALRALDVNFFEPGLQLIESELEGQPELQARLLKTVAVVLSELGRTRRAIEVQEVALTTLRAQLGDENAETLLLMQDLGVMCAEAEQNERAEELLAKAYSGMRRLLGEDDEATIGTQISLAATLDSLGRSDEAEAMLREVASRAERALGPRHGKTLLAWNNLGAFFWERERLDEAEPLFEKALEGTLDKRGASHPDTLAMMRNLSALLTYQGKFREAEQLLRPALDLQRVTLGDEHPETIQSIANLGITLQRGERLADALPLLREALQLSLASLGDGHPLVKNLILTTVVCLQDLDKEAEAIALVEELLATTERSGQLEHAKLFRKLRAALEPAAPSGGGGR